MTSTTASADLWRGPDAVWRLHFILRFAVGSTAAFVFFEFMEWQPAVIAAVLTGFLLANLSTAPPLKVGIFLVLVMFLSAWMAYGLTILLRETPQILFGIVGLILVLAYAGIAQARGVLPLSLVLVSIGAIPVITLTQPQVGPVIRDQLIDGMIAAVVFTYLANAIWPAVAHVPKAPPSEASEAPLLAALLGAAIVLPVMLVYLLFGWVDAMPVLINSVLLVSKMEEERGRAAAGAKMFGNLVGGLIAAAGYVVLRFWPTLPIFALIVFLISLGFGVLISKGGERGADTLLAFNAALLIFNVFASKGSESTGYLQTRLFQFGIVTLYVTGMMALLWPLVRARGAKRAARDRLTHSSGYA
jgi:hypothetical protein